jgi:pimeloyl-ACP methyl ester carboxylesterase
MSSPRLVGGERRRRPWVWLLAPQRIARERGDGVASTTPGDLGLAAEQRLARSKAGPACTGGSSRWPGRAPAVLVVHGWGGNASLMLPFAPELHRAGFHAFFLDVRNHGLSEPDRFVSMPRFADDLEVALDWLSERPEVTTIGVIGHSVGAGAAILSASRGRSPEAVVSVAAPADPGDLMRELMARLPRPLLAPRSPRSRGSSERGSRTSPHGIASRWSSRRCCWCMATPTRWCPSPAFTNWRRPSPGPRCWWWRTASTATSSGSPLTSGRSPDS